MAKRIFCLSLSMIFLWGAPVFGQGAGSSSYSSGPKQQLATIIFSGLGGAVLGLSTLSFYGRPQEKLNNIAIGFAVGVIGGTMYTTYQAATQPRPYYSELQMPVEFDDRMSYGLAQRGNVPLTFSYEWEF